LTRIKIDRWSNRTGEMDRARILYNHLYAGGRFHDYPERSRYGIAMAFKLIEAAQARWRAVNSPHLVALVRAGARFINGKLIERTNTAADVQAEAA
jgi:hypothetical protein